MEQKLCNGCNKYKRHGDFPVLKVLRSSVCKICTKRQAKETKKAEREVKRNKEELERKCYSCGYTKPVKEFHAKKGKYGGKSQRQYVCKRCVTEYCRKRYKLRKDVKKRGEKAALRKASSRAIFNMSKHICVECREEDIRILNPYRIDPNTGYVKVSWWAKRKDCVILCANCYQRSKCTRRLKGLKIDGVDIDDIADNFIVGSHPTKESRPEKVKARQKILDILSEVQLDSVRAFTLPGPWCTFEKLFERNLPTVPFMFTGMENDKALFAEILLNIPSGGSPIFGDVDDYLLRDNLRGIRYNFIWLDYQGMLTEKRIRVLKNLYRWMDVETILVLTFLKARERKDVQEIQNGNRIECLEKKVPEWIGDCEHIDTLEYKDSKKMVQTIYRIDSTR